MGEDRQVVRGESTHHLMYIDQKHDCNTCTKCMTILYSFCWLGEFEVHYVPAAFKRSSLHLVLAIEWH